MRARGAASHNPWHYLPQASCGREEEEMRTLMKNGREEEGTDRAEKKGGEGHTYWVLVIDFFTTYSVLYM